MMRGLGVLHDSMAAYVAAGALPGLITLVAHGDDVHVDTIDLPDAFPDRSRLLGGRQRDRSRHRP
jgi:hypothetical protein